jgi:hypothetical protein
LGGHVEHAWNRRHGAILAAVLAVIAILALSACGDDSASDPNEPEGTYPVAVTDASFPATQSLGQTYLMKLGIRNSGRRTIPALTVSVSVKGEEGETSTLPFAIHDPQPDLAQPDRPVWVLAEHYPKFAGSSKPGGSETSNQKTYDFGPLKAGEAIDVVWKLSAVRTGRYALAYTVGAGIGGGAKAETSAGVEPGGSFTARIDSAALDKEVTDSGEVVEKKSSEPAQ